MSWGCTSIYAATTDPARTTKNSKRRARPKKIVNRRPLKNSKTTRSFCSALAAARLPYASLQRLILTQGLVRYGSEADLSTRARAAYRAYRFNRYPNNTIEGLFRPLRSKAATQTHNPNERPVSAIKFIGVWDTVAAYGSPLEEITLGFSKYIWPLELPNHRLSRKYIEHGKPSRSTRSVRLFPLYFGMKSTSRWQLRPGMKVCPRFGLPESL